jgi:hypothetical protein
MENATLPCPQNRSNASFAGEWPEWKLEDDCAYQQWLDEVSKGGKD